MLLLVKDGLMFWYPHTIAKDIIEGPNDEVEELQVRIPLRSPTYLKNTFEVPLCQDYLTNNTNVSRVGHIGMSFTKGNIVISRYETKTVKYQTYNYDSLFNEGYIMACDDSDINFHRRMRIILNNYDNWDKVYDVLKSHDDMNLNLLKVIALTTKTHKSIEKLPPEIQVKVEKLTLKEILDTYPSKPASEMEKEDYIKLYNISTIFDGNIIIS